MNEKELNHLIKFFEGVNYEVSNIMRESPHVPEENLTFLLGKLMDSKSSLHQKLTYKISDLNYDLRKLGSHLKTNFEIYEHNPRNLENETLSDLAIILKIEKSSEIIEKGVLLQCKKLYSSDQGKFTINSEYEAIDKKSKQYKDIKNYSKKGYLYRYILYNPTLSTFEDDLRVSCCEFYSLIQLTYLSKFLSSYMGNYPGIKAASVDFVDNVGRFSLKNFYNLHQKKKCDNEYQPFSSFIIDLLDCKHQIRDSKILKKQLALCKGKDDKNEEIRPKGILAKGKLEIHYKTDQRFNE